MLESYNKALIKIIPSKQLLDKTAILMRKTNKKGGARHFLLKKRIKFVLRPVIALALCLCLVWGAVFFNNNTYFGSTILAKADSPNTEFAKHILDEQYIKGVQDLGGLSLSFEAQNNKDENQLVSPISLSMCGAMLMSGASGNTYDELKQALQYGSLSEQQINEQNKLAYNKFAVASDGLKISLSNGIWYNKSTNILDSFLNGCKSNFYADVFSQDFSDNNGVVNNVNKWVNNKTSGMINKIIDKVNPDEVMYLINAVSFEGQWETPFDKSLTQPDRFTTSSGSTITANFMKSGANTVEYKGTADFDAVKIPYKGNMYMVLALPSEGKTPVQLLQNNNDMATILAANWQYADKEASNAQVIMPKFNFDKDFDLKPLLNSLGVKEAFDQNNADFTRMDQNKELFVNSAKQKTYISLDEEKTKAAAITFFSHMVNSSMPKNEPIIITFNHPFLFAITDEQGLPLFMGIVNKP
jgi:serine protease inhibitor